ncbi:FixH family protein [Hymenobacter latericus]|uniref:FixH family protein n=1 Tax=Hymenobacter sp. YIM 151858-1 TaxID=2987688 RepID=UPI0022267328|nr:FixH family protein [Hymenobacter sp. YIM 151858-1]UYZ61175.1 FixH family protein [Hymenobacter sp. YIM 151858-1]
MKRLLLPVTLLATLTWMTTACSSNDASTSSGTPTDVAADGHQHAAGESHNTHAAGAEHSGGHIYSCPMHPEVTSDQPGTCPKCGMKLEHTDGAAGDGKTYQMNLTTTPAQPAAGQPVTLSFQPQVTGNEQAPVPLAVVHEKKMHLIIVSKDLSEFYHEHPDFKASGRYDVPFTFKTGGTYLLYQDYQPQGGTHQLGRQTLQVSGPTRPAVKFTNDQLRWQKNGYTADLAFDKTVKVGQPLAVGVTVNRGGKPVTDLDNYLGALGHMVVLSEDGTQYLHVHPEDQADKGPRIGFHTTFEKPGRYRVFLQFNHAGAIQTADFTVNVAPTAA